jgi:secreted PhoX family phosphatase
MTAGGGQRGFNRRSLLGGMAATAGAITVGRALVSRDFAFAEASAGDGPYGPLGPANANGIQLPAGFTSRIIAVSRSTVTNSTYEWHVAPDGGACFPKGAAGWVYASNSEVGSGGGGVGVIEFSASGNVVGAYAILSGTSVNCAGGRTPWYTWLSCEEVASGRVYECNPFQQGQGTMRAALGTFAHEAAAVDPQTSKVYLTEDNPSGRLYRFTPATPGSLAAGTLEAARVTGTSVSWVATSAAAPDRQANTTAFDGGEGAWIHGRSLFFTTKGDNRVWELGLDNQQLTIVYEASTTPNAPLTGVDNVTVHPASGDLFVAEDGGNMEVCSIAWVSGVRRVSPFLRIIGHSGSEVTGPAFSPDGSRLYLSSQRGTNGNGVTYEIAGPFRTSSTPGSEPPPTTTTTTIPVTTTTTTIPVTTTTTAPTTTSAPTTSTTPPTTTTPPPATTFASDTFERTVVNGFGTADVGGAWSLVNTSTNFAVSGGAGRISIPGPGVSREVYLNQVSARDVDARVDMSVGSTPIGSGAYYSLLLRRIGNTSYAARVRTGATFTSLELLRLVNGGATVLAAQTIAGYLYTPGDVMHVKAQVVGSGTTALRAAFWVNNQPEPTTWRIQANDTTAALQAAGGVGVLAYASSSSSGSVLLMIDNLAVTAA